MCIRDRNHKVYVSFAVAQKEPTRSNFTDTKNGEYPTSCLLYTSPQTAGIIHTDFERGFIRAEVIKYDDYVALGSEKACRDQGKIGVEGKEYVVQDGDIMHFLFNV